MPESEHALATDILTDYASDDPDLIADLLMDADPKAFAVLFPVAQRQESKTLPLLQGEIAKKVTTSDADKDSEKIKDRWRDVKLGLQSPCYAWKERVTSFPCFAIVTTPD